MILHFRQMEFGRLAFSGQENPQKFDLAVAGIEATGDLEYTLEAGLSGGGVWVCGSLRLPVRLECVNCLETFPYVISVPNFALQIDLAEMGGGESLDLTEWIREDILLALPTYPKCDADGGRTCSAHYPTVTYAPPEAAPPDAASAWAALDALAPGPSQSPPQTN